MPITRYPISVHGSHDPHFAKDSLNHGLYNGLMLKPKISAEKKVRFSSSRRKTGARTIRSNFNLVPFINIIIYGHEYNYGSDDNRKRE